MVEHVDNGAAQTERKPLVTTFLDIPGFEAGNLNAVRSDQVLTVISGLVYNPEFIRRSIRFLKNRSPLNSTGFDDKVDLIGGLLPLLVFISGQLIESIQDTSAAEEAGLKPVMHDREVLLKAAARRYVDMLLNSHTPAMSFFEVAGYVEETRCVMQRMLDSSGKCSSAVEWLCDGMYRTGVSYDGGDVPEWLNGVSLALEAEGMSSAMYTDRVREIGYGSTDQRLSRLSTDKGIMFGFEDDFDAAALMSVIAIGIIGVLGRMATGNQVELPVLLSELTVHCPAAYENGDGASADPASSACPHIRVAGSACFGYGDCYIFRRLNYCGTCSSVI